MSVWTVRVPLLRAAAERAKPGRGETLVGEFVQELIDQGLAQGLKLGRGQGRTEGIAEGEARTLTWLLEHRFGQLPRSARRRIEHASAAELGQWFKVALDARSLPEVFADLAADQDFRSQD